MRALNKKYAKKKSVIKRVNLVFCIAALCAAVLSAGHAADKKMDIEVSAAVGYTPDSYTARLESWTPVHILIKNNEKDISGYCELKAPDDYRLYRVPFTSPKNSSLLFSTYIHPEGYDTRKSEYTLDVVTKDFHIPTQYLALQMLKEDEYYFVVLSQKEGGLDPLGYRINKELNSRRDEDEPRIYVRLYYSKTLLLPRDAMGYDGVSAILWDGGDLTNLDHDQLDALFAWIRAGGVLFIFTGENWQFLKGTELEKVAGIELGGSKLIRGEEQNSGATPFVLAQARLSNEWETLATLENLPYVARRCAGRGEMYFVACRYSPTIPLNEQVAEHVLSVNPGGIFGETYQEEVTESLWAELQSGSHNFQFKLPPYKGVIFFLIAYFILIIPINYSIFILFKRLEWAWYMLPVIAIMFSLIAYSYAYMNYGKKLDANQRHLIMTASKSRIGAARNVLTIFSPMTRWFDVEIADTNFFPLLREQISSQSFFSGRSAQRLFQEKMLFLDFTDSFKVKDFTVYKWSTRSIMYENIIDLGGSIDVDLEIKDGALEYSIENRTPYELRNAYLVTERNTFKPLSDPGADNVLQPNESKQGRFDLRKYKEDHATSRRGTASHYVNPYGRIPYFKLTQSLLSADKAVLMLTTESYRDSFTNEIGEKAMDSDTTILVECPITNKEGITYLDNEDFVISVKPNSPVLVQRDGVIPSNYYGPGHPEWFEKEEYAGKKSFLTYGEQAIITFIPATLPHLETGGVEIDIDIHVTKYISEMQVVDLEEGTHYEAFAYNHETFEWEKITWGALDEIGGARRYWDRVGGFQIQLRFNLPVIEEEFKNDQTQYPFDEEQVFYIKKADILVTGKSQQTQPEISLSGSTQNDRD